MNGIGFSTNRAKCAKLHTSLLNVHLLIIKLKYGQYLYKLIIEKAFK